MSLSEGKMFTIEALNRIEGFTWPEGADGAEMRDHDSEVYFCSSSNPKYRKVWHTGVLHPNCTDSLITREEFESVDGWVRNAGKSMPEQVDEKRIDYIMRSGHSFVDCRANDLDWAVTNHKDDIMEWRYHKPQKQEVNPDPESNASDQSESQEGIESLISKHKEVKEIARLARIELERLKAAEHSLMLSIEAWAESHGFYIRVLSESEEKSELVITDWRDLRVGDIVTWTLVKERELKIISVHYDKSREIGDFDIENESGSVFRAYGDEIKFIRRPEKK